MIDALGREWETTSTHDVCEHHRKYPEDRTHPYCMCMGVISTAEKSTTEFQRMRNRGRAHLLNILELNAGRLHDLDLRIGQVISLVTGGDCFNIEDAELADKIETLLRRDFKEKPKVQQRII